MREVNFSQDALSKQEFDLEGHLQVFTDKGRHVLTLIHPLQMGDIPIPKEDIKQFKADILLHVHAVSLYNTLSTITDALEALKSGKITIFTFPIHELLDISNSVLNRASKID